LKILHFADLHLGVETYGHTDPTTGLSTRLTDFLASLDKVVDYAIENSVDLVIFCGDAYKTREPTQTQQREFARRINRLSSNDIPTFLLVGNHDLPNAIGRATSTEIFDTLSVKNVFVSNRPDVYKIPTRSGAVQVASLPWLRRSVLLSREETKNLDFEQMKEKLQQALTSAIKLNISKLDPKLPAILATHVWVAGSQLGTEKQMTIGQEHVLLLSSVTNSAFDYVALGHIHRHQALWENPPVVYAGSLSRLDFGDENDEKGFYLVDIEPGKAGEQRQVSFEFQPVEGRRFLTIEAALEAEDTDPTATVLAAIARQGEKLKEAIVRLNITVPSSLEGQLRDGEIREALQGAHFATVARETVREARLRLGQFTAEEITPLDALKKYLETKKTSPERTRALLEYGERLIRGEDGR